MAKAVKNHHWTARSDDYLMLAKRSKDPEIRQVCEHLSRVCLDVAARTEAPEKRAALPLATRCGELAAHIEAVEKPRPLHDDGVRAPARRARNDGR